MYYIYKDKVLVTDNTVLDGQLPNDEFFDHLTSNIGIKIKNFNFFLNLFC